VYEEVYLKLNHSFNCRCIYSFVHTAARHDHASGDNRSSAYGSSEEERSTKKSIEDAGLS
jgi:hypothetical protein